mmetsp:Transcript_5564/g.9539  ORF Transcript_5564/g.9539 Transcript_5564/m.9539 type:complete len:178 (+) Transcript_5564:2661-3194(+)
MVDFHLIMDLVPTLAKLFFGKKVLPKGSVGLSYVQSAILIGIGLQFKKVEEIEKDLGLNSAQILPQFNKMMRKFAKVIKYVYEKEIEQEMDEQQMAIKTKIQNQLNQNNNNDADQDEQEDDKAGGSKVLKKMEDDKKEFIKIFGSKGKDLKDEDISKALKTVRKGDGQAQIPGIITI